ncbi:MAG: CoA-binding protein [Planctomycetaceae bacterium]|nr:CoA-binding protein [Planctomycetaceae bacterium]HCK40870.1 CoA-binding protein [Planctomycetaceae bacterium]|tara:strand:- start:1068 stop:1469 length:402 start_codon:yes stop_codon:yes gene_type:complete
MLSSNNEPANDGAQPTVAILGASANRNKFGNKSVRAHAAQGYHVFPINPHEDQIEGFPAFKSILDAPVSKFNRVSLYVPPELGLKLIDQIAAKGCDELWLNPGSESEELVAKARELGMEPILACSIVDVGSRY